MKHRNILCRTAFLLLAAGLAVSFGACQKEEGPGSATQAPSSAAGDKNTVQGALNPLTGESGYRADAVGKRPVAIMINNAPAARPQWGLCSADIVMEGLAEGGVTRMMWLYADAGSIPEKVGSVRSARHDFVELAEGMDALFVHWGGSPQAYQALSNRDVDHIDGMKYSGTYFARDKTRTTAIEHRGYTTGAKVARAIEKLDLRTKVNEAAASPFTFAANAPRALVGAGCKGIRVSFSGEYNHTFTYDPEDGLYYTYMNGNKMVEDGGRQMAVTNVLILYADVSTLDKQGHVDVNLNSGRGFYVNGGKMEKIMWKKGTPASPLKLFAESGETLELNPGKSWIGFVPSDRASKTVVETEV